MQRLRDELFPDTGWPTDEDRRRLLRKAAHDSSDPSHRERATGHFWQWFFARVFIFELGRRANDDRRLPHGHRRSLSSPDLGDAATACPCPVRRLEIAKEDAVRQCLG